MPKSKASSKLKTSRSTAAKAQFKPTPSKPAKTTTLRPSAKTLARTKASGVSQKAAAHEPKLEEVLKIIDLMGSTDLVELELETPELKISLKRAGAEPVIHMIQAPQTMMSAPGMMPSTQVAAPAPVRTPAGVTKPAQVAASAAEAPKVEYHKIVSPMAGTFYRAPSPSAPPYVKEGDVVKAGQPVCIIEAMKLMNEIKADKAGKIVKVPCDNAQPVEKGTALFLIDPNA